MKKIILYFITLFSTSAYADLSYHLHLPVSGETVACLNQSGKINLAIHVPSGLVEARLQNHWLVTLINSEIECQRLRVKLVDLVELETEVTRQTSETREMEEYEDCRHRGPHGCQVIRTVYDQIEEILSSEILGLSFTSHHVAKCLEDYCY